MAAADLIALLTGPLVSVEEAKTVPPGDGLYAWWVTPEQLPGMRGPRHVSEGRELLYVAAAPGRAASKATLRQSIAHDLGTNINNSSVRFSLAALLHEREGWEPLLHGGLPRLTPEDDRRLSGWQERHLCLSWSRRSRPWLVGDELVAALSPPLNLAGRSGHKHHAALTAACAALRAKAATGKPRLSYQPPDADFLVGFDVTGTPIARNNASRNRSESATTWRGAIAAAARAAAATVRWSPSWRFAAVIEIRIPRDADIDNFIKDTLDQSKDAGVFAGDDKHVDLVHGIKRAGVAAHEAGARVEVWRLA